MRSCVRVCVRARAACGPCPVSGAGAWPAPYLAQIADACALCRPRARARDPGILVPATTAYTMLHANNTKRLTRVLDVCRVPKHATTDMDKLDKQLDVILSTRWLPTKRLPWFKVQYSNTRGT
jgi:uncharacterized protein YbcC (UPF0753/DUF2309 family)